MTDPLRNLDEYDRRHLTSHLVAAHRARDLHRLLLLEVSEEGSVSNAWYRAKIESDDASGFSADVETAWALAERSFATGGVKGRAEALGLECRYALIAASLNSLTENLPPNLLSALVEKGIRTPRTALSIIQSIPDPKRQAQSVGRLADQLVNAGLEDEVVGIVLKIDDEACRSEALTSIAPSISTASLRVLMPTVLAMTDEANKARVLTTLSRREDLPEPVLAAAVDEAGGWKNEQDAVRVLVPIARHIRSELAARVAERATTMGSAAAMATLTVAVAPRLGEGGQSLLDNALTRAYRARNRTDRIEALSALGHHAEAVAEAERIASTSTRTQAIAALSTHLSSQHIRAALDAVLSPGGAPWRAAALGQLAPRIPRSQWRQVLRKVSGIREHDARARALAAIAPHIPTDLLPRLLKHVLKLRGAERKASVLQAVAPRLGETELATVLAKVKLMRGHGDRGTILAAIVPYLSVAQAEEALIFVSRIASVTDRVLAIDALATRLPAVAIEQTIASLEIHDHAEALTALAAFSVHLPDVYRRKLLDEVVSREPSTWPDYLSIVADQLTPELLEEAVTMRDLPKGGSMRNALAWLADRESEQPELSMNDAIRAELLEQAEPTLAEARRATAWENEIRRLASESMGMSPSDLERAEHGRVLYAWLRVAAVLLPSSSWGAQLIWFAGGNDPLIEHFAPEAIRELAGVLAELELLDDASAAVSTIGDPLIRADALARLAPSLQGKARDDAISRALSLVTGALSAGRRNISETHTPFSVEFTGIGELTRQKDLLMPRQVQRLSESIMRVDVAGDDMFSAVLCSAMAALIPSLEDPGAAKVWALHNASAISSGELRAFALVRLDPLIHQIAPEDWLFAARAINRDPSHADLLVALLGRLMREGRRDEAIELFAEACEAVSSVLERDDRARALAEIARFASDHGGRAKNALWGTDDSRPHLLRRLSVRGRQDLLLDLSCLAPALDAVGRRALAAAFSAVQDVQRWWP